MTTRSYKMSRRQKNVEETRRRIVEAAVELHGSVGPAETTFSAVAEQAGVQRSTIYRHYPDEEALFGACTGHWLAAHPWPRADVWREVDDPIDRLRLGLGQLYRYYDDNVAMISNSLRDIDVMPAFVGEFMRAQINEIHSALLEPWESDLAPAIAHAIDFRSSRSLADAGLNPSESAELMTAMVSSLAGQRPAVANTSPVG